MSRPALRSAGRAAQRTWIDRARAARPVAALRGACVDSGIRVEFAGVATVKPAERTTAFVTRVERATFDEPVHHHVRFIELPSLGAIVVATDQHPTPARAVVNFELELMDFQPKIPVP